MLGQSIEMTPVVIGEDAQFRTAVDRAFERARVAAFPPPLDPTAVFLRPPTVAVVDGTDVRFARDEIRRLDSVLRNPLIVVVCRFDPAELAAEHDRVNAIALCDDLEPRLVEIIRWSVAGYAVRPRRAETAQAPVSFADDELVRLRMLSPTECRVLMLLAQAKSNKLIGRTLNISDNTVRVHMRSIFIKLGVENRTEAALLATRYRHCDVWRNQVADLLSAC